MSNTILKIENINKRLSEYFSLKDINIELNKGEVHAIVGENGSGKSSLMNILCGIYTKDSGSISIDGRVANIDSPSDAKKFGITIIHQECSLFEHVSVAENVFINSIPYINKRFKIVNFPKMHSDCQKLLDKIGLNISSKTLIRYLSPAQKQIIEIARAYASKSKIIIMDEPTSSLGESETSMLFNIINELKGNGVSVFYITHKFEELKQVCDKVSIMKDGKIISTQPIEDTNINDIFHVMAGFDLSKRYPKINFKLGKEVLKITKLNSGESLKDINLSLRKREILGLTGLIDSGGTRIAESIFGIRKIESGEISINGTVKQITSPYDSIKSGVAYVTEDRVIKGIFPSLRIYENLSAASISRVSNKFLINKKYEKEIAASYVDKLAIKAPTINDKVSHLSGGNQQKLVLAKWIMSKAKIFIFDEPTKGIDVASKIDVYNLMNELLQKGASIILISSNLHELIGMCDRISVLSKGRIVDTLPRQCFSTEKILQLETQE